MIPERISLKGFLSYDREQVLLFDGAPLWLLAGPNGSGKSSVFDGITFCFFGGHRGGKDDYHELINKQCDSGAVEFDFLLDRQRYRIRRTLKRNKKGGASCTQQVLEWDAAAGGEETSEWRPVPDTGKRADFDRWVQENIGLNFDTFTASVLLVQGKAENLLTSDPRDRHKMLARILGMERYEKLHARAVARRNTLDAQVTVLQNQLDGFAELTEADLEAAGQTILEADTHLHQARAQVEHFREIEALATRWAELEDSLAKIDRQIRQDEGLLAQAEAIEREWERLQELRTVLPPLKRAVEQGERLAAAGQALLQFENSQQQLADQLLVLEQALFQATQKRRRREQELVIAERRRRELGEEFQALALALPQLVALHRNRERLQQARCAAATAVEAECEAAGLVRRRETEQAPFAGQLAAAMRGRHQADHVVTQKETLQGEILGRAERFRSVVGDKRCRYCGQPLTAEHAREEQAKLEKELAAAEAALRQALQEREVLARVEKQVEDQHRAAIRLLNEAQEMAAASRRRQEKASEEAERHVEACLHAYEELAEPFRSRVSPSLPGDWRATSFPAQEDLHALQGRYTDLKSEGEVLDHDLDVRREHLAAVQQEETRLERERSGVNQTLETVWKQLAVQRALQNACAEALAAARAELPAGWEIVLDRARATDLDGWQAELEGLRRRDAEAKHQALQRARITREGLLRQKQDVETQRDALAAEARRPPEEVRRSLAQARQQEQGCNENLLHARNAQQRLLDRQEERRRLVEDKGRAAKEHSLYRLLAKYLDRDRLQRHLMRQAEQAIVAYAREILDRLSGGHLCLQSRGDDAGGGNDKALVLEAYRGGAASQTPYRVEMLSGSERFRVAVSLALAIGQYASRQHRPIQSVIIDEGFGCLDPTNRQLMIQELHNLQGQLHRILLVSHQEEFADAFTNGYRFDLDNGSTTVKRFSG